MTQNPVLPVVPTPAEPERKPLPEAAKRALAEAEARRAQAQEQVQEQIQEQARAAAKEFQGPQGPEPTRFGDWERKGIASDF
jgi:hypothetical protein